MALFFLTGCDDMMNTPTKRVEEFLGKYQIMDQEVIDQLDATIKKDDNLTEEQKDEYKALMEKQYQNLSYKIKNEVVDGEDAEVAVEISVFDYESALEKAEAYISKNETEFETDHKRDREKEWDYKIKQMKSVVDKVQYTLEFEVSKEEEKKRWNIKEVDDDMILKLHGLYSSDKS